MEYFRINLILARKPKNGNFINRDGLKHKSTYPSQKSFYRSIFRTTPREGFYFFYFDACIIKECCFESKMSSLKKYTSAKLLLLSTIIFILNITWRTKNPDERKLISKCPERASLDGFHFTTCFHPYPNLIWGALETRYF